LQSEVDYVDLVMQSAGKVDNFFAARLALLDAYQANAKLYNCYDISKNVNGLVRPLALVAKHKAESDLNYMWKAKVERFARSGAHEIFGLALDQALKLPMWRLDELLDIADKIRKEKNSAMQNVHKELEALNNGKI